LEYAAEGWDHFYKNDINYLEMVQHKAVHFVLGLRGVCSITEGMEDLGLKSLEVRRSSCRKISLFRVLEQGELNFMIKCCNQVPMFRPDPKLDNYQDQRQ